MRINTSKFRLVKLKVASVDCELLLIAPLLFLVSYFLFLVSSKACIHVLGFFNQSYDFSRKSLSKYLMDMIDFNKHDIDIFLNLAIVETNRAMNDDYY
jgi:hypothetical protein